MERIITAELLAELAAHCNGQPENCGCPMVVYENEDGLCSHPACMGLSEECGEPIRIE